MMGRKEGLSEFIDEIMRRLSVSISKLHSIYVKIIELYKNLEEKKRQIDLGVIIDAYLKEIRHTKRL